MVESESLNFYSSSNNTAHKIFTVTDAASFIFKTLVLKLDNIVKVDFYNERQLLIIVMRPMTVGYISRS